MNGDSKTLVIIPARNEKDNIEHVISEIRSSNRALDILVVNDGSTDETSEIARKLGVRTADIPFSLGVGGAVQTGFKVAQCLDYESVVQVDADGQHDPSCIQDVMKPITSGDADISIGSRRLEKQTLGPSVVRSIGIGFFSWLTSRATSQLVTDCSSGFRALNRRAFTLFSRYYPADFPDAQALVYAHRAGL